MLVWSGAGPLALVFFAGFQLLAWLLFQVIPFEHYVYGIPVAALLAAICTWVTGRRLNRDQDPPKHTFYDIRMEYWGVIFFAIVIWMWWNYLP